MPPMLYVLIFLAVFLAVEGLASLLSERRSGARAAARRRLRQIALGIQSPDVQTRTRSCARAASAPDAARPRASSCRAGVELERRLYQAGLTSRPAASCCCASRSALGAWFVGLDRALRPVPRVPVRARRACCRSSQIARLRAQRMRKFEEQFPEALDLLTRAMRAGHSLTFGLQMVGDELPDPIGTEFGQVAEEIKLGRELRVALGNLVYRVEAGDLPFFVTAITIQRETGGNLAEVLEKLGTLIRERFELYGKVRALTAIGKASANLLA